MLPLDTIFGRFQRPVRDLANERGKQVRLVLSGGAIEVDKRILEEIADPLVHMLRNAVDHGIESPNQRTLFGKPSEGTIKLSALQKGSHVVIQVEDDGHGIDPLLLRQAAVAKNLMTETQAEGLSNESALDLIFRPGFSTRASTDEISGRGYGMDIVQQNVKRLNGRVSVVSTPGQGSVFNLEIPLTLATMGALLVRSAGQLFALPSVMVSGIHPINKNEIRTLEGKKAIRMQGQVTPVVDLCDVLGLPPLPSINENGNRFSYEEDIILTVLLNTTSSTENSQTAKSGQMGTERAVAFVVDELVDEREVVVKNLGSFLSNIPNIAGATVLGADGLALILDVFGLLQSVRMGQTYSVPTPTGQSFKDQINYWTVRPALRVLVVDDSLATRELERSILEAAGYQVETARDGVEALQACRERPFDLVLTDVEMPNMDGFRLASAIHSDTRLHSLPVVIVSSRDSDQDRKRGLEAGAQAYIVKSHFEQNRLLDTVAKLLGM
jgi:two-component system chemotaxis sensor kinase CheA